MKRNTDEDVLPRIGVVSSYFPLRENSYRGHSAFQTLLALAKTRQVEIDVICPLAKYPWRSKQEDITFHHSYQYGPINVIYTSYAALPGLSRPVNGWNCLRAILPVLKQLRPSVILNYFLYPEGFSAVEAGRRLGIPVIVGAIGSDLRCIPDRLTGYFVRRTLRDASAVITVSKELRSQAIAFGAAAEKVRTVLNGCDHSIFRPGDRQEARRRLGYDGPPQGELILFAGNLLRTKGLNELLEAFAAISRKRSKARLAIAGEGPFAASLERRASAAGIRDRLLMLGGQPSKRLAEWMKAADLFCLPSYSEGCPNVVVEALSCGTPVVATNVGGIPELVRGDCGILIPPRNEQLLATAMEQGLLRFWDRQNIAGTITRTWADAANETYNLCRRVTHPRPVEDAVASSLRYRAS